MKYVRVEYRNGLEQQICYGILEDTTVQLLTDAPWNGGCPTERVPLLRCNLLAPVTPSKVVAVGVNYRSHAEEMGDEVHADPVLFLKPSTAVIGPGQVILCPQASQRVDYEAELAVVIGKTMRSVPADRAMDYVAGFTCLNDVTARDLQKKDGQWTRGKGFDTFCPIGPWIVDKLDHGHVTVTSRLNGEVRQNGSTSAMLTDVPHLLAYISSVMTLLPGDVVTTGTPDGIGPMKCGDVVEIEVEGIGVLRNPVR